MSETSAICSARTEQASKKAADSKRRELGARHFFRAVIPIPSENLRNGFSKKVENLRAAVGLHFGHYNFVRQHTSLRITPAMAAGVSDRMWTLEELVEQTSK